MATKKKTEEANVTRVVASNNKKLEKAAEKEKSPVATKAKTAKSKKPTQKRKNPVKATGSYFAGAWSELRQVRWPTRRATWGMTAALLGFTAFFVALILLLDALFKYVFQLILG